MAPRVSRNDAYLLDRSAAESVRLNSQRFLWSSHLGYVLHPSVPVRQNFRVADVGCGNAIWLLDLSQKLPPDARLDGFDLSDKQFPAERLRPANLYFSTLNLLETVPAGLKNAFDLVHVRVLASVFSPTTIVSCLSNIRKMLKPGGYVQWEDADTIRQAVHGEAAYTFEKAFNNVLQDAGIDWSWVPRLPSFLEDAGFAVLQVEQDVFDVPLKQLATTTFLLAVRQVIHGVRRALGESPASAATYKLEDMLNNLLDQHNSGLEYTWQPIYLLAQLPVGSDA